MEEAQHLVVSLLKLAGADGTLMRIDHGQYWE